MVVGLTNCVTQKVTPSSTNILTVSNPTNQVPKLIHVSCDPTSDAVALNGYIGEAWYIPEFGISQSRNGANGGNVENWNAPVNQTPMAVNTFYISASTIELYKGNGSITSRWHTSTEYTVEIYTDESTTNIGDNLLANVNWLGTRLYDANTGIIGATQGYSSTESVIPIDPAWSCTTNDRTFVFYYKEDGSYISRQVIKGNLIIPSDARMINVSIATASVGEITIIRTA